MCRRIICRFCFFHGICCGLGLITGFSVQSCLRYFHIAFENKSVNRDFITCLDQNGIAFDNITCENFDKFAVSEYFGVGFVVLFLQSFTS